MNYLYLIVYSLYNLYIYAFFHIWVVSGPRAGCDIQRRDALQRSPLLEAARRRFGAVVEALCRARANADAVDGQGRRDALKAVREMKRADDL